MNKKEFIKTLASALNYEEDQCIIINDILENNFFISKKSKDKILDELKAQLDVSEDEALRIYDVSIDIVKRELKDKIRHPLRGK
ncbi:MAG: hypothetical protein K2L98_01470 [Bacilli bacterium]|nr:hypothetical protein [Bacilli bacterium]